MTPEKAEVLRSSPEGRSHQESFRPWGWVLKAPAIDPAPVTEKATV
jgi:hypothetical protein